MLMFYIPTFLIFRIVFRSVFAFQILGRLNKNLYILTHTMFYNFLEVHGIT